MLTKYIRNSFLNFFALNDHKIVESSSVVPHNDPSLLFTNAGMVQFKNIFTGLESREYTKATTVQKCIRAGGKHNDLDQVGFTARHHTFFEMLGNFSFGDYFKEEAIYYAWTFLTKELGINKSKLLMTVYHTDVEALNLWKKIAGNNAVIIPIDTNDNFWSMGDTGPCGPCSEIFFDHGDKIFGGMPGTPTADGDRFMEIWNIVFMQFEQLRNNERINLKKQSIDTGMGLERVSAVMQGVTDNYSTDMFRQLITSIKDISQTNFDDIYPSYKVIADHIRSISFLLSDGVLPSNEGRGYVLRRILRRAMRHGNLINIKEPFLYKISSDFIEIIKDAYPELIKHKKMIETTVLNEEEKFLETLERGLKILQQNLDSIPSGGVLDGEKAFKLYDTYGFPLDLTQDILKSSNISVDLDGFAIALDKQRNRAKWSGSGDQKDNGLWHALKEKHPKIEFSGYKTLKDKSKILGILYEDTQTHTSENLETFFLVTQTTPFYAESGGQSGDIGYIVSDNAKLKVINTLKFADTIIAHKCIADFGYVSVGENVTLAVDEQNRKKTAANHTATHLLQAALRSVLGEHIAQRGSNVSADKIRFDFSHNTYLSQENIFEVENKVNNWIRENLQIQILELDKNEAIAQGALALFGEKYGEKVRAIKIANTSFELCGGTHANSTGEIGAIKILSESSVGSGVRRIEAISGDAFIEFTREHDKCLERIAALLKCSCDDIENKVKNLSETLKSNQKLLLSLKEKNAILGAEKYKKNNINVIIMRVNNFLLDELRSLHDYAQQNESIVVVVAKEDHSDKIALTISVNKDICKTHHAGTLLKSGLSVFDGKGGGSAVFAQGGGECTSQQIDQSIAAVLETI